ncbi:ROK family transcriptional regulator [Demetria terragena]|uniref:ROK family transcriptional regulator n=1 Tax=Demetria terragena TaxID=63959 RepID=UPI0003647324|nr:ROK family protein [Demetria terragena]
MESVAAVREPQLRRLVDVLAQFGPLTRDELMKETGWARSTVSRVTGHLLTSQLLVERDPTSSGERGRPATRLALNPDFGVGVGLDFGARHVRGVIADATHEIAARAEVSLTEDYTPAAAAAATKRVLQQLLDEAGSDRSAIVGVTAAVPTPVDRQSGSASAGSLLPAWSGINVRQHLTDATGFPVLIDNDSKLAAYGELRWGAGREIRDFLYFKLHSGVGGAVVTDGRLTHGSTGAAGHLGHLSVDPNGPLCRCGGRGCLETLAGVPAILDSIAQAHGEVSLRQALVLLNDGDPAVLTVITEASRWVGRAAGILANVLNPSAIILGGAMSAAYDYIEPPLSLALSANTLPINRDTRVLPGALGRDASALGALATSLKHGLGRRLTQ